MDLVEALAADGLVAVVGAGGKKSTIYELAGRLDRAVVTASVRIPIFDDDVERVVVTDDPVGAVAANDEWPLGVVPEREREDRYLGYDPATIAGLADADVDAVLVKADGARSRLLKAPDDREPQIPRNADTVLPVASARVVGKSLDDTHVHRPERVAEVAGIEVGDELTAEDVAAVLANERGGLKDVPRDARVVPVVNMVDDESLRRTAREIADGILERTTAVDRVALTRMDRGELVDVVS
ncbi:putative selenium-dependent hydroxylase accessory protein YqeC [Natronomonas salina]|uniref:selenium cofactor biosynthesis protein YqeC n=1 Tax=Natronomonas salina TaxID=1710540 RepID=UPI0015B704BE|nr:selenium cofactor biosynthesis protein YqeC [Natronomonas salina]QLD87985.1 putative selenium-dependent hydroxylase accessory protein YqeC [Natronomonas salina]